MSLNQNVYNEAQNSSSNIITTKWIVEPGTITKWNHRDIEYNNAGIPVLRFYPGENKKVYKEVYINGVRDTQFELIYDTNEITLTYNSKSSNGEFEIFEAVYDNGYISSNDVGFQGYLSADSVGRFSDNIKNNYIIKEQDLLIIVEKEPIVTAVTWAHENPLFVSYGTPGNAVTKLRLKAIYSNGDSDIISDEILNNINFSSSNIHAANIYQDFIMIGFPFGSLQPSGWMFNIRNYDEKCTIHVNYEDLQNIFGENINNLEPLTVVLHKNVDPELLLTSKFHVEYNSQIPMINVGTTYNINIYGIYELTNGEILKYNIDDAYEFDSLNDSIVNPASNNNTLHANGVGTTSVFARADVDEETSDIPEFIEWQVRVIKTLDYVDWNINNSTNLNINLNIGYDEAIINVIAHYDDGSIEDISNSCSFKYNENTIKVEGNKIIPIAPGSSDFSILASIETGNIDSEKKYHITCIQPMEDVDIEEQIDIDKIILDNTELELYIGNEKDLTYSIYPENATPQPMTWMSTDESVVSVDNSGHIKVLTEGYARIYVGVKTKDVEVPDEEDRTEESIPSIYSNVYAYCDINALAIKVTGLKCNVDTITCYVGGESVPYTYVIEPAEASNKDITLQYEGNERGSCIAWNKEEVTPQKEGSGILKVISVDNPEVYDIIEVKCIDNRVKKVIVNSGNDSDYEWYDNFTVSPEVDAYKDVTSKKFSNSETIPIDKVTLHEKWDDDDFPRYYCPINNSLQLNANILPSGASFSDLIWYSSDGELVRCTKDGIITPIRQGRQELDMYGPDASNDEGRRFPNTTWITAYNKKGKVAGVCQVRVTKNNITGISIGEPAEHDYDIDVLDTDGELKDDYRPEHDRYYDYVIWRGDEVTLPVTISVQDPNFGPSNNIEWLGSFIKGNSADFHWTDIVSLNDEYISHKNKNLDFDWASTTPNTVNNDKKNLNVILKGEGIGSIYFYARVEDNEQYYAPLIADNAVTGDEDSGSEDGVAIVGDYKVSVTYYGTTKVGKDEVYQAKYINGASVNLNANNQISVVVPSIYYTDENNQQYEQFVDRKYSDKCNRIEVQVENFKTGNPVNNMTVLVEAYRKVNKIQQSLSKTDSNGYVINPSINSDTEMNTTAGYMINNARPGEGIWTDVDKSRTVRVKVVDKPKNIIVRLRSMARVISGESHDGMHPIIAPNQTLKIKYSSKRSVPCFITFDDEFIERLNEYADGDECPLDDKYLSYAWFTSDPDVFIPIESTQVEDERDIVYPTEEFGNRTQLPSGGYTRRNRNYNLKGYGRYMNIQPTGQGTATLTIVNIMSGQTFEAKIRVE